MAQNLRLRRGKMDDLDGLYALATIPLVYRYLFDGEPPSRAYIAQRLADRVSESSVGCFGLWFLQDGPRHHLGCVELRPYEILERQRSPGCYTRIIGDAGWHREWRGAL
jgi:hypothetical protein